VGRRGWGGLSHAAGNTQGSGPAAPPTAASSTASAAVQRPPGVQRLPASPTHLQHVIAARKQSLCRQRRQPRTVVLVYRLCRPEIPGIEAVREGADVGGLKAAAAGAAGATLSASTLRKLRVGGKERLPQSARRQRR
jgi:hypothetical protein